MHLLRSNGLISHYFDKGSADPNGLMGSGEETYERACFSLPGKAAFSGSFPHVCKFFLKKSARTAAGTKTALFLHGVERKGGKTYACLKSHANVIIVTGTVSGILQNWGNSTGGTSARAIFV